MSSERMNIYVPLIQKYAARVVMLHSTVAEKLGIHTTDLKCLRLLGNESMTAGSLAELTGLSGAAATALIDRLEASGYVVRERDTVDRRRVVVRAVPEKVAQIDRFYEGQYARMTQLLSRYSEAEFLVIMDFLKEAAQVLAEETTTLRDTPAKAQNQTSLVHGGNSTPQARDNSSVV